MKAVPALLNKSVDEMQNQYETLSRYFSHFQIDICDGKLVPNTTITIKELIEVIKKWPEEQTNGKKFDLDLMVTDFSEAIEEISTISNKITISNIFLHSRALKNTPMPRSNSYAIGIAIDPEDAVSDLDKLFDLKSLKGIQIMTVNPGFQGSPFLQDQLLKIEQLRKIGYRSLIFMDGGINDITIPQLVKLNYRPDVIGMGSFLTKAKNIQERLQFFHKYTIEY